MRPYLRTVEALPLKRRRHVFVRPAGKHVHLIASLRQELRQLWMMAEAIRHPRDTHIDAKQIPAYPSAFLHLFDKRLA
ncbi:hypothetical protein D3C85_1484970 [compost metagenome]